MTTADPADTQASDQRSLGEVTAFAPIRVCDVGGWTDTWFSRRGKVFNIAVSPGVEIRVQMFEPGALAHGIVLEVANFGDRYGFEPGRGPGRHPLIETVIDDIGVPDGLDLQIRVASEVPAGSSTGTSAAVAVALIGALDALAPGPPRSLFEVAQAAHRIEVERLGWQSGLQDQLCAAFGGVSFIEIDPYPEAVRVPLRVPASVRRELQQRLILLHLGRAHRSSEVHEQVIARLVSEGEDSPALEELRMCAVVARDSLLAGNLEGLGGAMARNTDAQRSLHEAVVSAQAQAVIAVAAAHGATGWKVNGAGGAGGSVSLLGSQDPERRQRMERALLDADPALSVIPTRLSQDGLTIRRLTPPGPAS